MERLGENLADLRKRTPRYNGSFSMSTTLRLGIQMIDSLEGVHKLGYIHRDVKPVSIKKSNINNLEQLCHGKNKSKTRTRILDRFWFGKKIQTAIRRNKTTT